MDSGSGFPDGPAGDEQTGRKGGFGVAERGERGASNLLAGLSGARDDGAGEVRRKALLEPFLRSRVRSRPGI